MRKCWSKMLSLLCAATMAISCLSVGSVVSAEGVNLALGATVFVDSVNNASTIPSSAVDGSTAQGSRWQSQKNFANKPYFGVSFDGAQTAGGVVLYWHNDSPAAENGIKVSVAYEEASLAVLDQTVTSETCYTDNGTVWTEVEFSVSRVAANVANTNVKWKDTVTFETPLTGVYAIKITGVTRGTGGTNMSCFEIEVYEALDGVPYSTAGLDNAITCVNRAYSVDNTYGYSDESWTALENARAEAATVMTLCGTGANVGSVDEYPTQESVDAVTQRLLTAAACLTGNGTVATNVMENGIMIYDADSLQNSGGHNHRTLTDGAWVTSGNNCWQPKNTGTPVYIKLANASAMNEMVLFAENTKEIYGIEYTTADVTNITDVAGMEALSWTDTGATREYSVSYAQETAYSFYTFNKVEDVTAIKLTCTTPNGVYAKLREVEAYYDVEGANTTIEAPTSFSSDGQQFFAVAVDKKDVMSNTLTATYTIRKNGGEPVTRTVTIDTAYAAVSLGGTLITAEEVGGHRGDYVTGILFTGLDSAATYDISVEFGLNG